MKLLLLVALGVVATLADDTKLLKDFAKRNVKFTAKVYKELLKYNSGNFLVCPLSVQVVLALLQVDAKGVTAKELAAALQLPENPNLVKQTFRALTTKLQGNKHYNLSSANKIYVSDRLQISDTFKRTAVKIFHTQIDNIDFTKSKAAAKKMNSWVKKQTHDKIKDLISKEDLVAYTGLVLINALYFHGHWITKFDKNASRKRNFFLNNNNTVKIDMMEQTYPYKYFESKELNAKFLEMPYEGSDISMTIVLPNDKDGLGALEANIEQVLAKPNYSRHLVHVVLPKVKIETTIDFVPILQSLGVTDALGDYGYFPGISANRIPMKISKVFQKSFIEVEEEGTTGTAAAAVGVAEADVVAPRNLVPEQFIADHPYIFILKTADVLMFVGHVIQDAN